MNWNGDKFIVNLSKTVYQCRLYYFTIIQLFGIVFSINRFPTRCEVTLTRSHRYIVSWEHNAYHGYCIWGIPNCQPTSIHNHVVHDNASRVLYRLSLSPLYHSKLDICYCLCYLYFWGHKISPLITSFWILNVSHVSYLLTKYVEDTN